MNPVIDEFGHEVWRNKDGRFHRVDGPAVEWVNGNKFWHVNGKRHREDGPAVEWVNGDKEWWLHGERLLEEKFRQLFDKKD